MTETRRLPADRRIDSPATFHHVYLWEGQALVLTDNRHREPHRHVAVQVVVSLGDTTAMRLEDGDWHRCRGTVVASDAPHAYDSHDQPTAGLWIDPASTLGRRLRDRYLVSRELAVLDDELAVELARIAPDRPEPPLSAEGAHRIFRAMTEILLEQQATPAEPLDPRVERVLRRLEGAPRLPPVGELATSVGLSTSRLQHLVREEIGIPLSRWVLWRRTLVALQHMVEGATSTEAAFAASFADAPDFTRRFREFFAAPPTAAVQDPRARWVVASRLGMAETA